MNDTTTSQFDLVASTLGAALSVLTVQKDALFLDATMSAFDLFEAKPTGKAGKLTKKAKAFVEEFGTMFHHKGAIRTGWDKADLNGSTFRQYKARSIAALEALLLDMKGVEDSMDSLSKLAELVQGDAAPETTKGGDKGKKGLKKLLKQAARTASRLEGQKPSKANHAEMRTLLAKLGKLA